VPHLGASQVALVQQLVGAPMSASGITDWYSASTPRQHRAENTTEQSPPDTRRSSAPGARVQPRRVVQLNHLSAAPSSLPATRRNISLYRSLLHCLRQVTMHDKGRPTTPAAQIAANA
jgi:hypothetical protein